MIHLRIEHPVPDFDGWKRAFDGDPVGRRRMGVRRFRVLRPLDNRDYAIIELEFDTLQEAEALLAAMQQVWGRVAGTVMRDPRWQFTEVVESQEITA